jgi:hypothetical protein
MNDPVNTVVVSPKELKKYLKVQEKDTFRAGDYVHILGDTFAVLGLKNGLLKKAVSKGDEVYRKVKK